MRNIAMLMAATSLMAMYGPVFAKRGAAEGSDTTKTETVQPDPAAAAVDAVETKATKSIVPSKYAGKYKAGQRDALGTFIDSQCVGKDGFEWPAFFALCRKNGLAEDKVAHYEAAITNKEHGAQGRSRMTLRNMLATPARKNGKLLDLAGNEVAVDVPKPALTGAAKAAKEAEKAAA